MYSYDKIPDGCSVVIHGSFYELHVKSVLIQKAFRITKLAAKIGGVGLRLCHGSRYQTFLFVYIGNQCIIIGETFPAGNHFRLIEIFNPECNCVKLTHRVYSQTVQLTDFFSNAVFFCLTDLQFYRGQITFSSACGGRRRRC